MRSSVVALAVALTGAAAPALADARILTVQEQVQVQAPEPVPAPKQEPAAADGQDQAANPAPAQAPAQAQDQTTPQKQASVPSRYNFQRVDDGFLRLDKMSGHIAFCSPHTVGWVCQAVPEDRAALEKEIARLQGEVTGLQDKVASLQHEVTALREPPPPPPPPRPPADLSPHSDKGGGLKLPTDEEIARARTAVENAWRRLMDMMTEFKNDMMRKVQPERTTL